ncbi:MAG: helix-turn-helix domain-containing protein [Aeromicrobium sp.]|uniref:PucR family transcriptional regulator n=1 Tax=Aeromicrobium sp. TaxID=1871063 RepID=UPI00261968C8|nr:helix-turn-helix domain-containing protein [Aeromicrobium sp.]MDF1705316.1 helix-turn-helix domain-containing protein [Aeromicrobium sp.]
MSEPDEHDRGVPQIARLMSAGREQLTAELVAQTLDSVVALDHDERMRGLLEASIDENLMAAVNFLERGGDVIDEVTAPSAALTYARTLAQRDVPLSALIRAYRIGHSRFLDEAMPLIATLDGVDPLRVSAALVRSSAAYIDRVCDQVGAVYEVERDRWVSSRSGLRQQWLAAVLDGQGTDVRQAEKHLDYTLDGIHVAMTLWPGGEVTGLDVPRVLEEACEAIHRRLAARGRPLVVPHDEREVSAWFRLPRARDDIAALVAEALEDSDVTVFAALGAPAPGIDGFRGSLAQSAKVAHIRLASGRETPQVTSFDDVEAVAMMASDLPAARRLVTRVLGRLAGPDPRSEMLRATLREFLARRGSFAATAEAQTMHRNTVQYRVQQAAEVAATDLHDPRQAAEVVVALELCWWLGRAVTG